MNRVVVLRPQAEEEIHDAIEWYEEREEGLGARFLQAVDIAIAAIVEFPMRYSVVHGQIRRARLGRFPYGLFYRVTDDAVLLLACFHGHRDPKGWQDRT